MTFPLREGLKSPIGLKVRFERGRRVIRAEGSPPQEGVLHPGELRAILHLGELQAVLHLEGLQAIRYSERQFQEAFPAEPLAGGQKVKGLEGQPERTEEQDHLSEEAQVHLSEARLKDLQGEEAQEVQGCPMQLQWAGAANRMEEGVQMTGLNPKADQAPIGEVWEKLAFFCPKIWK